MSAGSDRAIRRELRRVAGANALTLLDQHTGHIQGLGALNNQNHARIEDLVRALTAFAASAAKTAEQLEARIAELERPRTLRERLRMLCTGRYAAPQNSGHPSYAELA